jgi:hypothetical protein
VTYDVYWEGVSGPESYVNLTGYGGYGGSLTCSNYDLVVGCEPDFTYAYGYSAWDFTSRFVATAHNYSPACGSYSCNEGDPVTTGWECYCNTNSLDTVEVTHGCCCS